MGIQTPTIGLMTIPYCMENNGSLDPSAYHIFKLNQTGSFQPFVLADDPYV